MFIRTSWITDALQFGLTATPKDHIDHNTLTFLNAMKVCRPLPTPMKKKQLIMFSYLSDFEVFGIQTKFQQEGINSSTIAEAKTRSAFSGWSRILKKSISRAQSLRRRSRNKGTNTIIEGEFVVECIKDPMRPLFGQVDLLRDFPRKHALGPVMFLIRFIRSI